jgi:hypothetical protein
MAQVENVPRSALLISFFDAIFKQPIHQIIRVPERQQVQEDFDSQYGGSMYGRTVDRINFTGLLHTA